MGTEAQPMLNVRGGSRAVEFYKAAFGAEETYRLEDPDGNVVSRLRVGGATFWVTDESPEHGNPGPQTVGGSTVRLVLVTPEPDRLFAQAIAAGADEVFPVSDEHGWRLGRLKDPFGHHWEIGYELA